MSPAIGIPDWLVIVDRVTPLTPKTTASFALGNSSRFPVCATREHPPAKLRAVKITATQSAGDLFRKQCIWVWSKCLDPFRTIASTHRAKRSQGFPGLYE